MYADDNSLSTHSSTHTSIFPSRLRHLSVRCSDRREQQTNERRERERQGWRKGNGPLDWAMAVTGISTNSENHFSTFPHYYRDPRVSSTKWNVNCIWKYIMHQILLNMNVLIYEEEYYQDFPTKFHFIFSNFHLTNIWISVKTSLSYMSLTSCVLLFFLHCKASSHLQKSAI